MITHMRAVNLQCHGGFSAQVWQTNRWGCQIKIQSAKQTRISSLTSYPPSSFLFWYGFFFDRMVQRVTGIRGQNGGWHAAKGPRLDAVHRLHCVGWHTACTCLQCAWLFGKRKKYKFVHVNLSDLYIYNHFNIVYKLSKLHRMMYLWTLACCLHPVLTSTTGSLLAFTLRLLHNLFTLQYILFIAMLYILLTRIYFIPFHIGLLIYPYIWYSVLFYVLHFLLRDVLVQNPSINYLHGTRQQSDTQAGEQKNSNSGQSKNCVDFGPDYWSGLPRTDLKVKRIRGPCRGQSLFEVWTRKATVTSWLKIWHIVCVWKKIKQTLRATLSVYKEIRNQSVNLIVSPAARIKCLLLCEPPIRSHVYMS